MEWLGHLARISNDHLPEMCLFGWHHKTRLSGGLRRRSRNVVRKDLNIWELVRVTGMGLPRTECMDWRSRWSAAISE